MRTTLTLDDDVTVLLRKLLKTGDRSLKALVNEALRAGLRQVAAPRKAGKPFHTTSADLGACRLGNVDNIADVLAVAEGERYT